MAGAEPKRRQAESFILARGPGESEIKVLDQSSHLPSNDFP
jgi:hypothetical protein